MDFIRTKAAQLRNAWTQPKPIPTPEKDEIVEIPEGVFWDTKLPFEIPFSSNNFVILTSILNKNLIPQIMYGENDLIEMVRTLDDVNDLKIVENALGSIVTDLVMRRLIHGLENNRFGELGLLRYVGEKTEMRNQRNPSDFRYVSLDDLKETDDLSRFCAERMEETFTYCLNEVILEIENGPDDSRLAVLLKALHIVLKKNGEYTQIEARDADPKIINTFIIRGVGTSKDAYSGLVKTIEAEAQEHPDLIFKKAIKRSDEQNDEDVATYFRNCYSTIIDLAYRVREEGAEMLQTLTGTSSMTLAPAKAFFKGSYIVDHSKIHLQEEAVKSHPRFKQHQPRTAKTGCPALIASKIFEELLKDSLPDLGEYDKTYGNNSISQLSNVFINSYTKAKAMLRTAA